MTIGADPATRRAREGRFWDNHTASLGACLAECDAGPDPNTSALLDALEPLVGKTVLDVGCGTGVLSAWLAQRGADVTGIDVSLASIKRARELAETLGLDVTFVCHAFPAAVLEHRVFDRLAGRYVLHHLELNEAGPAIAGLLAPNGMAAFVETMATNPFLRLSRKFLVGKLGVPRYGTEDESPLRKVDLEGLAGAVGVLSIEVAELRFLRILDRQIFRYRSRVLSRMFARGDDALLALGLNGASYHQVLVLTKLAQDL